MGGELEKATLQEKSGTKSAIKTANRNRKSKLQAIVTDENNQANKKGNLKTALKTTNTNNINEPKRVKDKKKKEKISVISII